MAKGKYPFVITEVPPQKNVTGQKAAITSLEETGQPAAPNLQFRIFSVLWAIASLFHMAHSSVFDVQLNLALLTVAAFRVIFRPSLFSFLLLISLQIFDAAFRMPFSTNHWIFTAFVNVTILQAVAFLVFKHRSLQVGEGALFKVFAPVVRIEVIILYFFAVFHKLNSGFFDPVVSCATDLLKAQNVGLIVPMSEGLFVFNAYLTLAIELMIPLLLCFQRTSIAGVVVGLVFHCILSYSTYNAFYDFSSVMFAAYFVFLAPDFSQYAVQRFQRLKTSVQTIFSGFSATRLVTIVILSTLGLGVFYLLNKSIDSFQRVHLYFFWTVYSLLFAILIVGYIIRRTRHSSLKDYRPFAVAHWSLLMVPVLVFVNGTLPYLGLKTENSYAMFSNLRTEGGKTNHFIIPATMQVFDYQKEVVEIVSSTDPYLQQLARQDLALVLFEFKSYVNERRPERVEYLLNGERKIFERGDKASLQTLGSNPYVLQKLMKFRPFAVNGPQPCEH